MRHPGRTKERLAEKLSEALGTVITAYDLREAKGYWRTARLSEALRWEVPEFKIGSYSRMTDCVRHGFSVERGTIASPTTLGRAYSIAINANLPSDADLLRDANSRYSQVQLDEIGTN